MVEQLIRNQQVVGSSPISSSKKKRHPIGCLFLVRVKGLEPLAYWFVASHSIQLSYTRK